MGCEGELATAAGGSDEVAAAVGRIPVNTVIASTLLGVSAFFPALSILLLTFATATSFAVVTAVFAISIPVDLAADTYFKNLPP